MKGTEIQSKNALKLLYNVSVSKNIMVSGLVDSLFEGLTFSNPHLHVCLKAFTIIFRESYETLNAHKNKIISFVMDEVIISSENYRLDFNTTTSKKQEWCEIHYDKFDKIKLKKAGIKLLKEFLLQQSVD